MNATSDSLADAVPHVAHDCWYAVSMNADSDFDFIQKQSWHLANDTKQTFIYHSRHSPYNQPKFVYWQNNEFKIQQKLAEAKALCQKQGLRFTAQREQIYRHILESATPLGAYDILAFMQQQRNAEFINKQSIKQRNSEHQSPIPKSCKNKKLIAPPTVYRGLEFLLKAGFIHQLTSINAFVPCCHPRQPHLAAFLICEQCGRVQEHSNTTLQSFVKQTKNVAGFLVQSSVIEMTGLCDHCH